MKDLKITIVFLLKQGYTSCSFIYTECIVMFILRNQFIFSRKIKKKREKNDTIIFVINDSTEA